MGPFKLKTLFYRKTEITKLVRNSRTMHKIFAKRQIKRNARLPSGQRRALEMKSDRAKWNWGKAVTLNDWHRQQQEWTARDVTSEKTDRER